MARKSIPSFGGYDPTFIANIDKSWKTKLDRLRDNMHRALSIIDQFLPNTNLKRTTEKLYYK